MVLGAGPEVPKKGGQACGSRLVCSLQFLACTPDGTAPSAESSLCCQVSLGSSPGLRHCPWPSVLKATRLSVLSPVPAA